MDRKTLLGIAIKRQQHHIEMAKKYLQEGNEEMYRRYEQKMNAYGKLFDEILNEMERKKEKGEEE